MVEASVHVRALRLPPAGRLDRVAVKPLRLPDEAVA